ncbi:MAG: Hsp33 family molecular chaperone [Pseudomonadota bacterium]
MSGAGAGEPTLDPADMNDRADHVLPFRLEQSGALGRLARLGTSVDAILTRHDYPDAISNVLGEALVLAALLGAGLKQQSRFTLQTQTNGPLNFLVVSFDWPDALRGYATFDPEAFAALDDGAPQGQLLGSGHLAMTIVPGGTSADELGQQYQGIVAMEGQSLVEAAHTYFVQSEQLPTQINVAVAKHFEAGRSEATNGRASGAADGWQWRAGGLIVQKLTWEGGKKRAEVSPGDENNLPPDWEDDDDWVRTRMLADTVEAHELTDPLLTGPRLLYRLFHEEGVRVFDGRPMVEQCTCSRDRVARVLARFPVGELDDTQRDDGAVHVTCEFCGRVYRFEKDEVEALEKGAA